MPTLSILKLAIFDIMYNNKHIISIKWTYVFELNNLCLSQTKLIKAHKPQIENTLPIGLWDWTEAGDRQPKERNQGRSGYQKVNEVFAHDSHKLKSPFGLTKEKKLIKIHLKSYFWVFAKYANFFQNHLFFKLNKHILN